MTSVSSVKQTKMSEPSGDMQCSRIRILRFFQISKKHDFLRFFEMTCQKNVKSC